MRRGGVKAVLLSMAIAGLALASSAAAQRGRSAFRLPPNAEYDGAFRFCRIMFRQNPNGDGNGWSVDYPRADINLPYRLSELTTTWVSKDASGTPNHAVMRLTDPEIYRCPFIMMTEPGALYIDDDESLHCSKYSQDDGPARRIDSR